MDFYKYEEHTGLYNMNFDSYLLDSAVKNQSLIPVLRLYGWKPACVSLGRNQNPQDIDLEYCHKNEIDVVTRATGGRALLHNDEITYSFICPVSAIENGNSVVNSYKEISKALIFGFKTLDIELDTVSKKQFDVKHSYCMLISTGADLCFNGKKLIGSAQLRKQGYILQHGSVLISYNKKHIENIFKENFNTGSITCISEIRSELTRKDIAKAIETGFKKYYG